MVDTSPVTRAEIYALLVYLTYAMYGLAFMVVLQIVAKVCIFSWVIRILWKVEDGLAAQTQSGEKVAKALAHTSKLLDIVEHHASASEREKQTLSAAIAEVKEETRGVARVAAGTARAATEVFRGDINKVPDMTVEKLKSAGDGSVNLPGQPGVQAG